MSVNKEVTSVTSSLVHCGWTLLLYLVVEGGGNVEM